MLPISRSSSHVPSPKGPALSNPMGWADVRKDLESTHTPPRQPPLWAPTPALTNGRPPTVLAAVCPGVSGSASLRLSPHLDVGEIHAPYHAGVPEPPKLGVGRCWPTFLLPHALGRPVLTQFFGLGPRIQMGRLGWTAGDRRKGVKAGAKGKRGVMLKPPSLGWGPEL